MKPSLPLYLPYTQDTGQHSSDFGNMCTLIRPVVKCKIIINLECRGPRQHSADPPFLPVSVIAFGSTSSQTTAMTEMCTLLRSPTSCAATRSPLKFLRECPQEHVASYSSWALGKPQIPADFSLSFREPEKTKADPQGKHKVLDHRCLLWTATSMTFSLFSSSSLSLIALYIYTSVN